MGQSNYHERAEDIDRPDEPTVEQDEHDPFSFASMCRVARQSGRLQALRAMLLAASVEKAERAAREEAEDGCGT